MVIFFNIMYFLLLSYILRYIEHNVPSGCYSCDIKYTKGHKCAEKKLFYIDCEEEEEKDQGT